jgi:predicted PhzF superfamily epimerase YddE/YHI9
MGDARLPIAPVTSQLPPFDIAAALGVPVLHFAGNQHNRWLAEFASEEQLRALQPDYSAMMGVYGVIATCRATTEGYDFMSRFFAPNIGINEDPVTGGAFCSLTPYWAVKLGKAEMVGYQASARGGVVRVRLADERVYLRGQAVTVLRGEMIQCRTAQPREVDDPQAGGAHAARGGVTGARHCIGSSLPPRQR